MGQAVKIKEEGKKKLSLGDVYKFLPHSTGEASRAGWLAFDAAILGHNNQNQNDLIVPHASEESIWMFADGA